MVLLLTHSGDYYTIDLVEAALRRRGAECFRFNTDTYPVEASLTVRFGASGVQQELKTRDGRIDLRDVESVWSRRLWPGKIPPEMEARFAHHSQRESRTAFFDGLALLSEARWVNPIGSGIAAESKLLQLDTAVRLGLQIPETIVTNEPASVAGFFGDVGGEMVTKLLGALSQTMDASGDFVYTSRVSDADMEKIGEIRYAPQIFQPLIKKKRELRAIFVGKHLFVGAIDASEVARAQVDWRMLTNQDGVSWRAAELPAEIEAKTRQLMREMGLLYGAVDFIIDEDGRHIFLEINQAGEWGWLERDLDFPIADALALTLLDHDVVSGRGNSPSG